MDERDTPDRRLDTLLREVAPRKCATVLWMFDRSTMPSFPSRPMARSPVAAFLLPPRMMLTSTLSTHQPHRTYSRHPTSSCRLSLPTPDDAGAGRDASAARTPELSCPPQPLSSFNLERSWCRRQRRISGIVRAGAIPPPQPPSSSRPDA